MSENYMLATPEHLLEAWIEDWTSRPLLRLYRKNTRLNPVWFAQKSELQRARRESVQNVWVWGVGVSAALLLISLMLSQEVIPWVVFVRQELLLFVVLSLIACFALGKHRGDEKRWYNEAMRYIELHDYLTYRLLVLSARELSKLDEGELKKRVKDKLIEIAYDVRKLELKNQGIPEDHWKGHKAELVTALEAGYRVAGHLFLVDSHQGYDPYYAAANNRLREETAS